MATTRNRRAGANPPEYPVDQDGDRMYTEEDYATDEPAAPIPDEWATRRSAYPPAGWTGEAVLPDEAFKPDEEDSPDESEWAEEEDDSLYYAAENGYDPRYAAEDGYDPRYADEDDYPEDLDPLSEDLLTEEEQAELRRSHWQLISGLADFAGVILGTAAILLLVTLLVSLVNWLVNDLNQSFILLQKNL